jgi:hypothetical protein
MLRRYGTPLTKEQIVSIARRMMQSYGIEGEFVRYPRAAARFKP